MPDRQALRFRVIGSDGRSSDVWRIWIHGNDVYLAPRTKAGEFKISLHESGKWRTAFTAEYAMRMQSLGTWNSDRSFVAVDRPPPHAPGLTRAVRLYFPDSELGVLPAPVEKKGKIVELPGPAEDATRVVDVIFTSSNSRYTETTPPLSGSLGVQKLVSWQLSSGETLWAVYFELKGLRGLDAQAQAFRSSRVNARKLDDRSAPADGTPGRIMIAGQNDQGWLTVIDAAH